MSELPSCPCCGITADSYRHNAYACVNNECPVFEFSGIIKRPTASRAGGGGMSTDDFIAQGRLLMTLHHSPLLPWIREACDRLEAKRAMALEEAARYCEGRTGECLRETEREAKKCANGIRSLKGKADDQ